MTVGEYLKDLRLKAGLTQGDVANEIGISQCGLSYWERGICVPEQAIVERITAFLKASEVPELEYKKTVERRITKRKPEKIDDKLCRTCIHWRTLSDGGEGIKGCHYILDTGHRRPCEAGSDCTEYKKGKYKSSRKLTMGNYTHR